MTLVFFMLDNNHPEHTPLFKYSSCVFLFDQTMDKSANGGKLFFYNDMILTTEIIYFFDYFITEIN